jgi:hypothetical protein
VGQVPAAATVVVAVAESVVVSGSAPALDPEAVFVIVEPPVTVTRSVTTDCSPEAREARGQETVPVPPTAGAVQVPHPEAVETERKVVLAGTVSVSVNAIAVAGPSFVTTIV